MQIKVQLNSLLNGVQYWRKNIAIFMQNLKNLKMEYMF